MPDRSFEPPYGSAAGTPEGGEPATRRGGKAPGRVTRGSLRWLFSNRRTGRITIVQFPNVALWIFFATVALRWVVPSGTAARTVVDWAGVAALSSWAVDEVIRGVNPWRRLLGAAGCTFALAGLASLVR